MTTIWGGACGAASGAGVTGGFAFTAVEVDLVAGGVFSWAKDATGDRATKTMVATKACRLNIK